MDGLKVYYRCKKLQSPAQRCPAAIYLLYHTDGDAVSMYRSDDAHEHGYEMPKRGIKPEVCQVVKELYRDGKRFSSFFFESGTK